MTTTTVTRRTELAHPAGAGVLPPNPSGRALFARLVYADSADLRLRARSSPALVTALPVPYASWNPGPQRGPRANQPVVSRYERRWSGRQRLYASVNRRADAIARGRGLGLR